MKKAKRIVVYGALIIVAVYMFFLGIVTERKWAAKRIAAEDSIVLIEPAEKNDDQDKIKKIKIEDLDYPEALTRDVQNNGKQTFPDKNSRNKQTDDDKGVKTDRQDRAANKISKANTHPEVDQAIIIQLGAFQSKSNAQKAISIYKTKGLTAKIERSSLSDGNTVYRVVVGPYKNRDDAAGVIFKLKLQNIGYLVKPVGQ